MHKADSKGKRRMGWIGWSVFGILLLLLALFAFWQWAVRSQSVALLDRADAIFTGSSARTSAPIAFGAAPEQVVVVAQPLEKPTTAVPVVIFIHGGSWAKGNAPDYAFVARNMAELGFVGVSAGYRLVPGGEYPAMLEDGAAAVRWVQENIAQYGGDPSRIYLMGHSAGAYNAIMLALDPRWLDEAGVSESAIRGAIGLAGPYDFLPLDSEGTINAFGGADDPSRTQPINFARKDAPPLLLLTGDADTTVRPRNSTALAKAMTEAGQPTEAEVFAGLTHSAIVMALARPFEGDGTVKQAIGRFIAQTEERSSAAIQPGKR